MLSINMKTLKFLAAASLALVCSFAARADIHAQAWLETYYLNPQPDTVAANIKALSHDGYFEKPGHTAIGIGFLATVFAQNPTRVESWLGDFAALPAHHQRLVAAALWQAGHPGAGDLLRAMSANSSVRSEVLRLADTPAQLIGDTSVRSASSMNLQWGAFLAGGDERHIVRILEALGSGEPGLDATARVAIADHASAHPRVMEICQAQLDRQPEEVQGVLRAALTTPAAKPRS